jgi:phospholipid/cholesterol/gamma-HCH transport system substrate-binding protein
MEIRARYMLIGGFVLAFILGMFGFVYWLQNVGGLGARTTYEIRFDQPVNGLTEGSSVLFNGIRVGAISELKLDPREPKRLDVMISVDPSTPIRKDTQVDVTYQGLTGAPAISLKGGEADAARLTGANHQPPILVAPAGVGMNLMDSARGTLTKIDSLIDENSKPLHTAITGFSTFADMLGRNSKRIEGMIGGLEKLTGGGSEKMPPLLYDLTAAKDFPATEKPINGQMSVPDVSSILVFDTQKILLRTAGGTYGNVEGGQWADNLPKLMQARVLESFENAHQLKAVSRPYDQLQPQYRLELGIRNFQIAMEPAPTAVVQFTARILDDQGAVIGAKQFDETAPAQSTKAADAVDALNAAFAKAAKELVEWTVGAIPAQPPAAAPAKRKQ